MDTKTLLVIEGALGADGARSLTGRLSLNRVSHTLIDVWLPSRAAPFALAVAGVGAAFWLAGFLLAADKHRFLVSREWQSQPVFLAMHFVTLRLFVAVYSRNFLLGCDHLDMRPGEASTRLRHTVGPWGWVAALAVAAPLAWSDFVYLASPEYLASGEAEGAGGGVGPADWLAGVVWAIEWLINAYVWVVIVAFVAVTLRVLKQHKFREEVEVVLGERQYRPFLAMSAQGATVVLLFSAINALYVWYARGEWTDYAGLIVTIGLLLFGFVPPWMRLKNGIVRLARAEAEQLSRDVQTGWRSVEGEGAPPATTPEGLAPRLSLLLTMARAGHLERLYRDFGRNEASAMLLRLLAPVSTVVWKIIRPF